MICIYIYMILIVTITIQIHFLTDRITDYPKILVHEISMKIDFQCSLIYTLFLDVFISHNLLFFFLKKLLFIFVFLLPSLSFHPSNL